jgi:hypothetical protein
MEAAAGRIKLEDSQTYQLHADATWLDFVGDTPVDILIVPPVGNYARNHSGKAVDCRC